MATLISRHKERLLPALDIQRKAWKLDNDGDAIECLLIDIFRYLDDLKLDHEETIKRAKRDYKVDLAICK